MLIFGLPWDFWLILIALAAVPAWRGTRRVRELLARSTVSASERLLMYGSTIAAQWFATGLVAWRVYARGWSWASVGLILGKPILTIAVAVVICIALAVTQRIGLSRLSSTPEARGLISYQMLRKVMPQSSAEFPAFFLLVTTVALCEEFLYRGFVLAAFGRFFGSFGAPAILCSAILFAVGHAYQGRPGLISTFILGLVFGIARVWTGSLIPGILAHFVTDSMAGILGPRLIQRAESAEGASPTIVSLMITV